MQLAYELQKADKQFDLMLLPHRPSRPGQPGPDPALVLDDDRLCFEKPLGVEHCEVQSDWRAGVHPETLRPDISS
jgi:hypothetical protein